MFRAAIVFLLLFALPAGADSPQQRSRKWWTGPTAKELGLTDEQSAKIDAIFETSMPRIRMANQDFQSAQKELNKLVAGDKTTETDVVRQLVQTQAARSEMDRQYTLMLFRFYRELSPEQRLKVRAMFDRREQERREGRRGQPTERPPIKR